MHCIHCNVPTERHEIRSWRGSTHVVFLCPKCRWPSVWTDSYEIPESFWD